VEEYTIQAFRCNSCGLGVVLAYAEGSEPDRACPKCHEGGLEATDEAVVNRGCLVRVGSCQVVATDQKKCPGCQSFLAPVGSHGPFQSAEDVLKMKVDFEKAHRGEISLLPEPPQRVVISSPVVKRQELETASRTCQNRFWSERRRERIRCQRKVALGHDLCIVCLLTKRFRTKWENVWDKHLTASQRKYLHVCRCKRSKRRGAKECNWCRDRGKRAQDDWVRRTYG